MSPLVVWALTSALRAMSNTTAAVVKALCICTSTALDITKRLCVNTIGHMGRGLTSLDEVITLRLLSLPVLSYEVELHFKS
jgi:hypothetical protein